jgi:D-threonate/D-erythronate kinase
MKPSRARPLTIVADDLTGACDTGALFTGRGPVPVSIWPRRAAADVVVRVVDTESRTLPAPDAAERIATVAAGGRARHWFKKIDSTLRGPVGGEVDALMRATGVTTAVICPAFPAQRRVVLDRALLVAGTPVAATPIARDPAFPAGAGSSVVDLLRPQLDRALAWIPIEQLRAGGEALTARVRRLSGTAIVADAETDADLDRLVDAALGVTPLPLLVGSAGLGRALAARLGLSPERAEPPPGGRWLVVAGSAHPATRRQLKEARAAGMTVLAAPERAADRGEVVARLVEQAVGAIEREKWDLVVVTGGETAVALWSALGADRMEVLGAPAPGLALGQLRLAGREPLAVLTKAGGFGPPDLLVALQKEVVA